jgi:hypothetical protein
LQRFLSSLSHVINPKRAFSQVKKTVMVQSFTVCTGMTQPRWGWVVVDGEHHSQGSGHAATLGYEKNPVGISATIKHCADVVHVAPFRQGVAKEECRRFGGDRQIDSNVHSIIKLVTHPLKG